MAPSRWLSLSLFAAVLASTTWVAAQPPRKEEEEDPKDKARPVVPVPVADPDKKAAGPPPEVGPDVGTFAEEAKKAKTAAARDLFRSLALPYDRLASTFAGGPSYLIELWPTRELPEEEIDVRILTPSLKESFPKKLPTGSGFTLVPFELVVAEQVDAFLARDLKDAGVSKDRQMEYAARALAAGLRWHLEMVDKGKRVGKKWDEVRGFLRTKLVGLQRDRFKRFVEDKEYDKAEELGLSLLTRFPDHPDVTKDVYRLQLFRMERSAKAQDADLVKLREAMLAYERLAGPKDEALVATVRNKLRARAKGLLDEARADETRKMTAAALAKLRQAEVLDPDLPGIAEARRSLRGKVLYVAVRQLPEKLSPALAATDAERWAAELIFEGLLQTVPDPDVIRYRPQLAEGLPAVMPLGRAFTLPPNVRWGREGGDIVDARDVRGTLDLLRRPGYRERWCADGLEVFEEIDRIVDPFRLRLAYRQGVLEPLSRATFKVIPARHLMEEGKGPDDETFARNPFGTGPFRYEGREREGVDRECAVFRANPHFGQRPGRFGLPAIREVRFFVPTQSSLAKDVTGGQLHLYPDAPPDVTPRFREEPALKEAMRVVTASTNRRVHILAVNHRQTALQSDRLRQGLSLAINRDAILKDLFRAGDDQAHAALTGPFPVRSWATPPAARDVPLYKPGAGALILEGLSGQRIKLRLSFLGDDPKNAQVCQRIKAQIEEASADKGGKPAVEVELVGRSAEEYRNKLYKEFDYDLCLATFDYRDDLYSLAGLLDPEAAGRDGRNFLGYLAPGTNPAEQDRRLRRTVEQAGQYRDFTKQVKELTHDVHHLFNQRVPFIPLWQLDRAMVVHRDLKLFFDNPAAEVKPELLDPAVVFTGVEMWRLE